MERTMAEAAVGKLSERERTGLGHLQQAKVLGISLAEYCRKFELDLDLWYRVKQKLVRLGLAEKGEARKVARIGKVRKSAAKKRTGFARIWIAATAAATMQDSRPSVNSPPMACRIVHPAGWVLECGTLPQSSWLATVLAGPRP